MFLVEVIFHIESTISYDLYIQLVEEMCEKLILKIKLSKKKSAESQALCFAEAHKKTNCFLPTKFFWRNVEVTQEPWCVTKLKHKN